MLLIKNIIKKILPKFIFIFYKNLLNQILRNKYSKINNHKIFQNIYTKNIWSNDKNNRFYSGIGSHDPLFVNEYVNNLKKYLDSFEKKLDVVDAGCGDFAVGSKIRKYFNNYIAVDIFNELIEFNKKEYKNFNVDFKSVDITKTKLPVADICISRQVLQHLSNEMISNFLNLIKGNYKYLIITEHLPSLKNFTANLDKQTDHDIRLSIKSGVDLTLPPFNVKPIKNIVLCETYVKNIDGVLRTNILQLKN